MDRQVGHQIQQRNVWPPQRSARHPRAGGLGRRVLRRRGRTADGKRSKNSSLDAGIRIDLAKELTRTTMWENYRDPNVLIVRGVCETAETGFQSCNHFESREERAMIFTTSLVIHGDARRTLARCVEDVANTTATCAALSTSSGRRRCWRACAATRTASSTSRWFA